MGKSNTLQNKLYTVASRYVSRAGIIEGKLKDSDRSIRCLTVGDNGFMDYVAGRTFAGPPRVIKQWRTWIPGLKRILRDPPGDVDICIAVLPKERTKNFGDISYFRSQEYVHQIIDTTGNMEEIKKRFRRNKRRFSNIIDKTCSLTYRISYNIDDFDFFYHYMFVPLIRKQHGALAYIESFEEMKPYFEKGFLLLVQSGGQDVSGALCIVAGNSLVFRRSGVLDGDERHIEKGAQLALYYFNILYAKEHGLACVDTMKSRSFLDDGVYWTKKQWGAAVVPDDEPGPSVLYFVLRYSEKIVRFFELNPVIINSSDCLAGLVGWHGATEPSSEEKEKLYKKYYARGLKELFLLSCNPEIKIKLSFELSR